MSAGQQQGGEGPKPVKNAFAILMASRQTATTPQKKNLLGSKSKRASPASGRGLGPNSPRVTQPSPVSQAAPPSSQARVVSESRVQNNSAKPASKVDLGEPEAKRQKLEPPRSVVSVSVEEGGEGEVVAAPAPQQPTPQAHDVDVDVQVDTATDVPIPAAIAEKPPLAPIFSRQKPANFGVRKQEHDWLVIYDLEATCNRRRDLAPIEIIEVAAVALRGTTLEVVGEYQAHVRPTEHPILDPFCIELTGITQEQVDGACVLRDVLLDHERWLLGLGLLAPGTSMLPITWTDWDLKICMEQECNFRKLPRPPYLRRWCDLKKTFSRHFKQTGNLRKCVEAAGLTWQGRAHCGLDDARNEAALVAKLVRDGVVLRVTEKFEDAPADPTAPDKLLTALAAAAAAAAIAASSDENIAMEAAGGALGGASVAGVAGAAAGDSGSGLDASASAFAFASASAAPLMRQKPAAGSGSGSSTSSTSRPAGKGRADGSSGSGSGSGSGGKVAMPLDASGRWTGNCACGAKAHLRTTKKPGVNHGRSFYSCGTWRITAQGKACGFFVWADQLPNAARGALQQSQDD